MTSEFRRRLLRGVILTAAMLGMVLLLLGILLVNDGAQSATVIQNRFFGSQRRLEPDRTSYVPGLVMTVSGAGLIGFAIGRGLRPARVDSIYFPTEN